MDKLEDLKAKYCNKKQITYEAYMEAKETLSEEEFKARYSVGAWSDGRYEYFERQPYDAGDAQLLFMEAIRSELEETKRYARNTWYFAIAVIVISVILFFAALL